MHLCTTLENNLTMELTIGQHFDCCYPPKYLHATGCDGHGAINLLPMPTFPDGYNSNASASVALLTHQ